MHRDRASARHAARPQVVATCSILVAVIFGLVASPAMAHEGDVHVDMDSGLLEHGDVFTFIFDEPGIYDIGCTVHANMTAALFVEADLSASGPLDLVIQDYTYQERTEGTHKPFRTLTFAAGTETIWTNMDDHNITSWHTVSLFNFQAAPQDEESPPAPIFVLAGAIALLGAAIRPRNR